MARWKGYLEPRKKYVGMYDCIDGDDVWRKLLALVHRKKKGRKQRERSSCGMGSVVFFMSRVDSLVACGSWCVSTKWQSDGRRWTSHIESPDPEVSEVSPDALLHGNTDGDEFVGMLLSFLNYLLQRCPLCYSRLKNCLCPRKKKKKTAYVTSQCMHATMEPDVTIGCFPSGRHCFFFMKNSFVCGACFLDESNRQYFS